MIEDKIYHLGKIIIQIIDEYISTKTNAFEYFIESCQQINQLAEANRNEAVDLSI
ncbi:MAG: hypothetical protein WBA93_06255 [Microcoleaceae cyanobacterium]